MSQCHETGIPPNWYLMYYNSSSCFRREPSNFLKFQVLFQTKQTNQELCKDSIRFKDFQGSINPANTSTAIITVTVEVLIMCHHK